MRTGSPRRSPLARTLRRGAALLALLATGLPGAADELPEYRLKAAIVYSFVLFTDWPPETGAQLQLCVAGTDPFGAEIDALHGKPAGSRSVAVQRKAAGESLRGCHVVFFSAASMPMLAAALDALKGQPVLTVADTPGAMRRGVALNMNVVQGRVAFEANLQAARQAGLVLQAKLLRLATEVQQ